MAYRVRTQFSAYDPPIVFYAPTKAAADSYVAGVLNGFLASMKLESKNPASLYDASLDFPWFISHSDRWWPLSKWIAEAIGADSFKIVEIDTV